MGKARPIKHRGKWRIRWTDHTGKRRSEVHERYEEAETALLRHKLEVIDIRSGRRAPIRRGKTHAELFDYWLEARATLKRSSRDDRSMIERHLRPAFGRLSMGTLTAAHIDTYVAARSGLSPKTVNNHLTLLTTMLNLAVELGWLARAPKIKKLKAPVCGPGYRYLRTRGEITRFLGATQPEDELVHVLYATALYTGMRAGEVAGLHWDDVDLDQRLITVCRSYDGPTKSGRVRPPCVHCRRVVRWVSLLLAGFLCELSGDLRLHPHRPRVAQNTSRDRARSHWTRRGVP
jgi:integrase